MRRHGPVIAHCTNSEDFPFRVRVSARVRKWVSATVRWVLDLEFRWKIFRIGTVRYNWPMSAHASQAFSMAASQLVTRSTSHPVDSSHGQLVTGQLVTRSTRHAVDSSQRGGQLVTSKQTSKHQSRTAAAVITLTCSPRSPPLLKKYTRIEQKTKWTIKHTQCDRVNLRPLLKPTSL